MSLPPVCELQKLLRDEGSILYMAASLGFEPRQRDPESLVLPLHYEATSKKNKDRCALLQVDAITVEEEFTRQRSSSLRLVLRFLAGLL